MVQNIIKLLSRPRFFIGYIVLTICAVWLWWYFTDIQVMFGNYGKVHTYVDIGLSIGMILGFPLFLLGVIYKWLLFGAAENMHHRTGIGLVTGALGTIISGASCCGPTLALYFWLLPLMNLLPYAGLELKVLSVLGLAYALWDLYRNLETCRVGKKKLKK